MRMILTQLPRQCQVLLSRPRIKASALKCAAVEKSIERMLAMLMAAGGAARHATTTLLKRWKWSAA